jgi:hypothetical protein
MRRTLCLGLLALGFVVLAGTAGAAPPSEGTLSIKGGQGDVTLDMRGAVLGRLAKGKLDIVVPAWRPGGCAALNVWGAEEEESPLTQLEPTTGEMTFVCGFAGKGIRFRVIGSIVLEVRKGRGLFLSAVGRGTGEIDGLGGNSDGLWALDDGDFASLPNALRRFPLGRPLESDTE